MVLWQPSCDHEVPTWGWQNRRLERVWTLVDIVEPWTNCEITHIPTYCCVITRIPIVRPFFVLLLEYCLTYSFGDIWSMPAQGTIGAMMRLFQVICGPQTRTCGSQCRKEIASGCHMVMAVDTLVCGHLWGTLMGTLEITEERFARVTESSNT